MFFSIFARGAAMGAAEVVPGVSGGTIALLVGVYDRLIVAISTIASPAIKELRGKGGLARFWKAIDGNFLVSLLLGMGAAILLFSRVLTSLLLNYPVQVWAAFFGLIVASIWLVGRGVQWSVAPAIMAAVGIAVGYLVSTAGGGSLPEGALGLFIGGAVAICAMILPGISGSFILLLLGRYHEVIGAVSVLDFAVLIPFALGALIGLLAFSHVLSWFLKRYHNSTIALLTGFMAGAIVKVWPWRMQVGAEPGLDRAVSPSAYAAMHGDSHVAVAIAIAVAACAFVLVLGHLENRKKAKA